MASIATVTEYYTVPVKVGGELMQVAMEPPLAEQVVDFTAGVTATANAFQSNTHIVRIKVNAPCSLSFGKAPVATTSMQPMGTGDIEYKGVPAGQAYRVSFISNTNYT